MIQDLAENFKDDPTLSDIEYTDSEKAIWKTVFGACMKDVTKHGCKEYLVGLNKLVKTVGVNENEIPQLNDISNYMTAETGWTIRPVAGLISPRDFFDGLANKVFCST
jgi:phenylalanine-4-hydroxylase